ncbi:MAG: dTMP kinase [Oscillospiraceae bacterium]|nr:dTMP kinase [Oscillospiraceae bacterium]
MQRFIVFEGLDGTGKTTQIKKLAEYLTGRGETVFTDAEPSALPSGKYIRRVLSGEIPSSPWATAALFLADRINQNIDSDNGIKKHLDAGETVILDRYYFSTFAYQGYETDMDWAMDMHYRCPELEKPDLVLFLTMSPEKCIDRITQNRADQPLEIYETTEKLTEISEKFNTVFEKLKDKENIVYIDASGSVDEVHERIVNAVNASNPPKLALFDFDGTVIDNSRGIYNCINYACDKMGVKRPGSDIIRRFVGPPLYDSYKRYIENDHERALYFVDCYRERFAPIGKTEAELYPNIINLLSALKADGYTLAVCSGKPRQFVMDIAKNLGIAKFFSEYYCPSFSDTGLDKGDYIIRAISDFGSRRENTVMIGDTKSDILAAKKAEVKSIGVKYGFAAENELEENGADILCETVSDIFVAVTGKEL